jgi:hypothetical protein
MSFLSFLTETGNISKYQKSSSLLVSYLKKNLSDVQQMPGVERFTEDGSIKFGLRFFYGKKSFRINYDGSSIDTIDLWTVGNYYPDHRIDVSKVSIAKALPTLLSIIKSPKNGSYPIASIVSESAIEAILVTSAPKTEVKVDEPKTEYEKQLDNLDQLIKGVIKQNLSNAFVLCGRGGVGKTHNVEVAISELGLSEGKNYTRIAGTASPVSVYKTLFDYRKAVILFDDCDSIFNTQEGRNIFKGATDTKKVRRIAWLKTGGWVFNPDKLSEDLLSEINYDELDAEIKNIDAEFSKQTASIAKTTNTQSSKYLELINAGKYPNHFDFEGKIIFISNLKLDEIDPDGALRTRAFVIEMNPTDDEVLATMAKIVPSMKLEQGLSLSKEERLKVIDVLKKHPGSINMRKLQRGINMLAAGLSNWEELLVKYG